MPNGQEEVLSNGVSMPYSGLGTWLCDDSELLKGALKTAVDIGVRFIDTATRYKNEPVIGEVLHEYFRDGKLTREQIFVSTKLPPYGHANPAFFIQKSLNNLHLDYIDLYLIHQPDGYKLAPDQESAELDENGHPIPDLTPLIDIWRVLEEYYKKGVLKAIGISNFSTKQIQELYDRAEIKPHNLQNEIHILWPQSDTVKLCRELNISITAFAPLGSPGSAHIRGAKLDSDCLGHPLVKELACKYNKTPAQILLRQLIQREIHVIPKSTNHNRIKENFDVFSFHLLPEDMKRFDEIEQRVHIFT
ncbi:aldo/keto reductase family domain-containing protein [Ditylenchus destructor]|nr:aldo/keto reductase family domain-containing protein [Ditylenchus destructor]